jgi:hypothetical protein
MTRDCILFVALLMVMKGILKSLRQMYARAAEPVRFYRPPPFVFYLIIPYAEEQAISESELGSCPPYGKFENIGFCGRRRGGRG